MARKENAATQKKNARPSYRFFRKYFMPIEMQNKKNMAPWNYGVRYGRSNVYVIIYGTRSTDPAATPGNVVREYSH